MKLSQAGIDLITEFEGFEAKAYQDLGGVWTIGYGHTGKDVKPGMTWSKDTALKQFKIDIASREKQLTDRLETVPTTQNQFDALLSLGYNIGMGALGRSEALENHILGRHNAAAQAFMNWTKVNGKVVSGLVRRRTAERKLYEKR